MEALKLYPSAANFSERNLIAPYMRACMGAKRYEFISGCYHGNVWKDEAARPECYQAEGALTRWIEQTFSN